MFSAADKQAIAAQIARVEAGTAAELVVAVWDRGGSYLRQRAAVALGGAWLLGWVAYALWLPIAWPMLWLAQPLVGCALWLLSGHPRLLRLLVSRAEQERTVAAAARRVFAERAVYDTRDRSGVLIFLCRAERRVVILGDHGVHSVVGDAGWLGYRDRIIAGVRQGQALPALTAVLEDLGARLSAHFPPRSDDRNELPDDVVVPGP
jgi:putative membrane protein